MVKIDVSGFARKIEEYHREPERPEEWFHPVGTLVLNDKSVTFLCKVFEFYNFLIIFT